MAYHDTRRRNTPKRPAGRPATDVGALLAALGDPTRREIVERLRRGPRSVGDLSDSLPVSRPAVSQHLKVLRDAGIVSESRAGVRHYFSLDPAALDALRCHFESLWQGTNAVRARPPFAFAEACPNETTARGADRA